MDSFKHTSSFIHEKWARNSKLSFFPSRLIENNIFLAGRSPVYLLTASHLPALMGWRTDLEPSHRYACVHALECRGINMHTPTHAHTHQITSMHQYSHPPCTTAVSHCPVWRMLKFLLLRKHLPRFHSPSRTPAASINTVTWLRWSGLLKSGVTRRRRLTVAFNFTRQLLTLSHLD